MTLGGARLTHRQCNDSNHHNDVHCTVPVELSLSFIVTTVIEEEKYWLQWHKKRKWPQQHKNASIDSVWLINGK